MLARLAVCYCRIGRFESGSDDRERHSVKRGENEGKRRSKTVEQNCGGERSSRERRERWVAVESGSIGLPSLLRMCLFYKISRPDWHAVGSGQK